MARLGLVAVLLTTVACGKAPGQPDLDADDLRPFFDEYLPALGQAYAERDPSLLEPYVVPKEVSRIEVLVDGLADRGQIYVPTLVDVKFDKVTAWNYANAYATTRETWDVRSYTLDRERLVNESLGQENLVTYQLKRKDDGWVVLYREVLETVDS
ncbi:MAG: hypothetical protein AAGC60_03390 [Acidobacteriota bacterium]